MIGRLKELTSDIQNKPQAACCCSTQGRKARSFFGPNPEEAVVAICNPKGKCEWNCQGVRKALQTEIDNRRLEISIANIKVGCDGKCEKGALLGFPHKGFFYNNVRPEDVPEIVQESFVNGYVLHPFLSLNPVRSYKTELLYEKETGTLASMNDNVCMVQVAKYFLDFEDGLSCGKCIPCRIGLKRMQECFERIMSGEGSAKDIEQIDILCRTMIETPHCNFAMYSSKPVLSALKYFSDEFKAHAEKQECSAGLCEKLVAIQEKRAKRRRK